MEEFYSLLINLPYYKNGPKKIFYLKNSKEDYDKLGLELPIENCTLYFKKLKDKGLIKMYSASSLMDSRFDHSYVMFQLA